MARCSFTPAMTFVTLQLLFLLYGASWTSVAAQNSNLGEWANFSMAPSFPAVSFEKFQLALIGRQDGCDGGRESFLTYH